ncbi:MAG TPA: helical backbone metal receptor [Fimbriimonadaceae bacterium]
MRNLRPQTALGGQSASHSARISVMRFYKWAVPALVMLLVSVGCQDIKHQTTSHRPKALRSVVSLSPNTSELAIMTLQVSLVGRGESDNFPANVKSYPVVMNGVHPDYEAIAKSNADGVLYDNQTISPADIAKLNQMKLVTIGVGGTSYDAYKKSLYEAAALLRAESSVNDYIQGQIDRNIAQAKAIIGTKKTTVAVIMPGTGTEHMIAGANSFIADLLRHIGATPMGPDADKYVKLNAEDFIKENPDVILVVGAPDSFASDPRFASMPAVKDKRLAGLDPDIALREGSRVDQLVQDMGNAIVKVRP